MSKSKFHFNSLLKLLVDKGGSDLYLSRNAPPTMRVHGEMVPMSKRSYEQGEIKKIAYGVMNDEQIAEFETKPEMNLAVMESGIGRFRVNVFLQQREEAMVVRFINSDVPHFSDLGLPDVLSKLIMEKRGLVLFVGGTGSGKSTSLASLIDYRNSNATGHIITIEDPVEFVHEHKKSIVNQREVGIDTDSYEDALQNTLRQAPDVILIGEIRSRETMEHALAFAETGHLCLSTLHANNADQALSRIVNFFPEDRHRQVLLDLSLNLRGFVSQRLVPAAETGRIAAVEILLSTARVRDLIRKGKLTELKEVMARSEASGMQTFDSALYNLYRRDKITLEEALKNADSPTNLKLRIHPPSDSPSKLNFELQKSVKDDVEEEEDFEFEDDTSVNH